MSAKIHSTVGQTNRITSTQNKEHASFEMQEFTEGIGDTRLHNDIVPTYDI